jgi:hypothetical protein
VHDLGRLLALARDSNIPRHSQGSREAHALCDSPLPKSRRARDPRGVRGSPHARAARLWSGRSSSCWQKKEGAENSR